MNMIDMAKQLAYGLGVGATFIVALIVGLYHVARMYYGF